MSRYAVRITELDAAWKTHAGSALLGTLFGEHESAEVVTIDGAECSVLAGPKASVAALVAGLLKQGVRVHEETNGRWSRVVEAPEVPDEDEDPSFDADDDSPQIDREFAALCGMLTEYELAALRASIVEHGCRDPLVIWREKDVLLDGHNRIAICRELGLDFDTAEYSFPDRDAARNWIIDNALARRSLTREQRDYLIGKRYFAEKRPQGGTGANQHTEQSGQSDHLSKTDARLATDAAISPRTVRRAAEYARAVDALAASAGRKARDAVLSGQIKLTRSQVARAAEQGVKTLDDLRALKKSGVSAARDVVAELESAAARVVRLAEEAIAVGLADEDRARLASVWNLPAFVERVERAVSRSAAACEADAPEALHA
jgi:hypothetical protein